VTVTLDLGRWARPIDGADHTVVTRCVPPVLDIGCGPGRFVLALAERGHAALGVDITPTAIQHTLRHGVAALHRDVFARTPGEGRWPTALLMDGNIGIGGDPARLLHRVRRLLRGDGRLIVEVHPHRATDARCRVRFRAHGSAHPWAEVGRDVLARDAESAGYALGDEWSLDGRSFVLLRP
jgi:SAM-dependent methyltransferase